MLTLNTISQRFVIALILALGANHVAAQEGVPTSLASPSPATQTMIGRDDLHTTECRTRESLNEAQIASERKSETARPASERLEVEAGYSYDYLTNGFAPWQSAHLFVGKDSRRGNRSTAFTARLCAFANATAKDKLVSINLSIVVGLCCWKRMRVQRTAFCRNGRRSRKSNGNSARAGWQARAIVARPTTRRR